MKSWRLRKAYVDPGQRAGVGVADCSENRELRRRNQPLEQGNEVLHRAAAYMSQAKLPGKGSTHS